MRAAVVGKRVRHYCGAGPARGAPGGHCRLFAQAEEIESAGLGAARGAERRLRPTVRLPRCLCDRATFGAADASREIIVKLLIY